MMRKPEPLSKIGKKFLKSLGRGALVGITLRIYKAKIKDLTGTKDFARHITGETITDDNKLIIYVSNDQWKAELQARRYQLKKKINGRLETDFITEIVLR